MTEEFIGLPLDEALALCAQRGIRPLIVETRSPRERPEERRSARVAAVRSCGEELQFVVAFFSEEGPKEPEHA